MSGRQQGESDGIGKSKSSSKDAGKAAGDGRAAGAGNDAPRSKVARKQRAADLGRALRSIYDDTLRESVPDDFTDLLGKLS